MNTMALTHLKAQNHREKGMALIVVLLLVTVFTVLGSTAMLATSTDLQISSNYRMSEQALYAAEAGAEYGVNRLRAALAVLNGSLDSVVPPVLSGFAFENTGSFWTSDPPAANLPNEKQVTGNFAGLTAYCRKYTLTSAVLKTNTNARAAVVYEVEDQLIPLFQFGIFYHNDLEMLPGANMTFSGGRIHSNHDVYMSTSATLTVNSIITTAGDILHKRKNTGVTEAGAVRIMNDPVAGTYHNLTLDSETDPTWEADALADWNGRVKSEVHGIQSINLPLPEGSQPIDILGTGSGSLYEKSGLRIIDGVAKDKNGNTIDLTANGNTNPMSKILSAFYDGREAKRMGVVQVDINVLKNNTVAMAALNDPPAGGEPGILYVSSTSGYLANPAVRLINGGTIPAGGLSVTTNNPLYVWKDYNTANGPAGIYADAVTVLSNNWSDANAAGTSITPISSRVASNTTVKAAIMAGNKDTVGAQYSGGVENFMRFLETWSGKTLNYSGSLTCLWQSQQAMGNWPGTGTVYNAPTRNWTYGMTLANLPPGTPRVRNVQMTAWRQALN
ncbi:MAG: PilX N-terminal domain-containing pilus assembly protein [Syntrophales bacterium]|nr:PilX N-terminal domain-containing pilus assembly protein [Syntrophales bacterium]